MTKALRTSYKQNESLINQTDLYGELTLGGLRHRYLAGVEFSSEEVSSRAANTTYRSSLIDSLHRPNANQSDPGTISWGSLTRDAKATTKAAYLFDTIQLSQQWDASFGLRYGNYEVTSGDLWRRDSLFNHHQAWSINLCLMAVFTSFTVLHRIPAVKRLSNRTVQRKVT